ncbi:MAG: DUF4339 domain-containing protein [Sandaracinaceae bacterium]
MADWYLNRGGGAEGPFPEREVASRIRSGRVDATCYAAPAGGATWKPLSDHPVFAAALASGKRAAPTLVGARVPVPPPSARVEHSLTGGDAPEFLAVPIPGERRRRSPWPVLGALLLVVVLGAIGGAAYWAVALRELPPLEVQIEDAAIEDVEHRAVGELIEEQVRLVVQTEAGARVRASSGPEVVADESGRATVLYPFGRTREPSVEVHVRAELEDGDRLREGRAELELTRPDRIRVRRQVAECSTHPCALGVEADGTLTASGLEPSTQVELGGVSETAAVPDVSAILLARMNPSLVFADESAHVELPLRFALEDGRTFEGVYPVGVFTLRKVLFEHFDPIDDGAITVPEGPSGRATLWIGGVGRDRSASTVALVGDAPTVSAIYRVALVTERVRRRACGRYGSEGHTRTVYVEQHDAQIAVYDRRRGRVVRRTIITAPRPACPSTVTLDGEEGDFVADLAYASEEAVAAWLGR